MESRHAGLAARLLSDNYSIMVNILEMRLNLGCDAVCVFFGLVSFLQATSCGVTWMGLAIGFSLTVRLNFFPHLT